MADPSFGAARERTEGSPRIDVGRRREGGVVFGVKVQPGARRSAIVGTWNGFVKVCVREPAEGGRANDAVKDLLARAFGVRRANVELLRGAASTRKSFAVVGLDADEVRARISSALAS